MSKKVIAMLIVAMFSTSLVGCGGSSKESNNDSTKNEEINLEEKVNTTEKWAKDFTLKEFTTTSDELVSNIEKKTKEYGLEYTEEEIVSDDDGETVNRKSVDVENKNAEKNRLQNMYFSRIIYGESLTAGQIKMKLLLNFDGKKAIEDNKVDLGATSIVKYVEILTGVSGRDYSEINEKVLEILKSSKGEGFFQNTIEGLTETVTVTDEYIVYSIETDKYEFKKAEQ
ncbi:MAG: hypothetical protein E7213_05660 [Clostridium sp.]|jgi:hypothetical protein|nr:hypothetical protein [Clostridium sp.]